MGDHGKPGSPGQQGPVGPQGIYDPQLDAGSTQGSPGLQGPIGKSNVLLQFLCMTIWLKTTIYWLED